MKFSAPTVESQSLINLFYSKTVYLLNFLNSDIYYNVASIISEFYDSGTNFWT